jgi:integrative and conjugative element protein (TIGR02256 family)
VASTFHDVGEPLADLDSSLLSHGESKRLFSACTSNPAFEVLELRKILHATTSGESRVADAIIVSCCDGTVPSNNAAGVKNRERLMLTYDPEAENPHDVRALRLDFPATPHQNHVPHGGPASLCLYFEPWSATERTWTPALHLQRILWWLRETAQGTLHRNDQPLERLYFVSPHLLVLPSDFRVRAGNPAEVLDLFDAGSRSGKVALRGIFRQPGVPLPGELHKALDTLVVTVPPIISTRIERYPSTLGELNEQLKRHGSAFSDVLRNAIEAKIPTAGLPKNNSRVEHVLLLVQIPVTRQPNEEVERVDVAGFLVLNTTLAKLAIASGAGFDGKKGLVYASASLGNFGMTPASVTSADEWTSLKLEVADVRFEFSKSEARRASGIPDDGSEFVGVLAGVGALGSAIAEIWYRERWGRWTFVDDDILLPHNIARHSGKSPVIGWAKVDVVAESVAEIWADEAKPKAIVSKVTNLANTELGEALTEASLLVDVTTTLEVPRDFSDREDVPRMASVFLTPSGESAVLLIEDAERNQRLSSIEAQYYRAIINSDWGASHLTGHQGSYWVGAGCRDMSAVLPQEVVQLHGALLARQVRLQTRNPEAQIRVWSANLETGAVVADTVKVEQVRCNSLDDWRVFWDNGLLEKLKGIREHSLPNETGGVVLGYCDQKRRAIQVVDVLSAPVDSVSSSSEFIRGAAGLAETIERVAECTSNIVGYVGEWHSHPRGVSATPSTTDVVLLASLAQGLVTDGVPALMLIVGEDDITFSLGDGGIA